MYLEQIRKGYFYNNRTSSKLFLTCSMFKMTAVGYCYKTADKSGSSLHSSQQSKTLSDSHWVFVLAPKVLRAALSLTHHFILSMKQRKKSMTEGAKSLNSSTDSGHSSPDAK